MSFLIRLRQFFAGREPRRALFFIITKQSYSRTTIRPDCATQEELTRPYQSRHLIYYLGTHPSIGAKLCDDYTLVAAHVSTTQPDLDSCGGPRVWINDHYVDISSWSYFIVCA